MSVIEVNKIDGIGVSKNTNEVVLTISDHLDWEDVEYHLLSLQEKINHYIHFVESGQIFEVYPESRNRSLKIDIVSKYEYPDLGVDFVKRVAQILESIEVKLDCYTI